MRGLFDLWWVLLVLLFIGLALGSDGSGRTVLRLFTLAAAMLGSGLLIWSVRRAMRRLPPAALPARRSSRLQISSRSVAPGEEVEVRWQGPSRDRHVRARLILRERSDPGDGQDWWQHEWIADDESAPADQPLRLRVPPDAMHSFGSEHLELGWLVSAEVSGRKNAEQAERAEVPLLVRAEVAS